MSLQAAAQHMASRGRGPDTMLVHMAPTEVAGLQALAKAAGGTLTTNPDTGLPEAGFLRNLLPTIIGAGLSFIPGVGPLMAAGIVGGGTALATGNLQKGLMAGLGAYGGAGLAGGLAGAGVGAAQQAAMSSVGEGASQAALNQAAAEATKQALANPFSNAGAGIQSLVGEQGRTAALDAMGGAKGAMRYAGAAAMPLLTASQTTTQMPTGGPNPYRYRYEQETPEMPYTTGSREAVQYQGRYVPYADGGPVDQMSERNRMETLMANGGQMYAAGGISHLGDYSDGGRLLKGPGDGVSDDIPATIGGKQPARLADGEFVVPARIVSELGNGSTEAGARKLYA